MVRLFALLGILGLCACVTEPLSTGQPISVGTSTHGYLRDAVALKDRGEGFSRLRSGEGSRYGTRTLVGAIERAARDVGRAFPGGYPLRVGDLSSPSGGAQARHRSHRSGRDADLLFYVRDPGGMSAAVPGWLELDRLGIGTRAGRTYDFDDARNWHLVRTLVLDEQARVQWLFCANHLKARLLRYAALHEPSAQAVIRATWVLHQPSRGEAHDDHFHLRVGCAADERQLGCREEAPHWPWLSDAARKADVRAGVAATDQSLVAWLFAEEHADQGGNVARAGFGATAKPAIVAGR